MASNAVKCTVPPLLVVEIRQVAPVSGDEPYRAEQPFSVEVIPSVLVAGLLPG